MRKHLYNHVCMYYFTGTHSYSFLIQREPIDLEAIQGYLFEPDVAVEEQDNDDIVLREQQRQEVCDFNSHFNSLNCLHKKLNAQVRLSMFSQAVEF